MIDEESFSVGDIAMTPIPMLHGKSLRVNGYRFGNVSYCTIAAMVEGRGATNNSYAMLDVFKDGAIHLKGYRKQETRTIPA